MKQFLSRPKRIILAVALLTIALGLLSGRSTVDMHLQDTYFVIAAWHLFAVLGTLFLFEAAIYYLTDNYRQRRALQYIHIISILLFCIAVIIFQSTGTSGPPTRYFQVSDAPRFDRVEMLMIIAAILFFIGQIIFLINLIIGFILGKKLLNR